MMRAPARFSVWGLVLLTMTGLLFSPAQEARPDGDDSTLSVSHDDGRKTRRFELSRGGSILEDTRGLSGKRLARRVLVTGRARYGLGADAESICLARTLQSTHGSHYVYFQTIQGTRVRGGRIIVSLDWNGTKVVSVANNYFPGPATGWRLAERSKLIGAKEAIQRVWFHLHADGALLERPDASLFVDPTGKARLVYVVHVGLTRPLGYFQALVDAEHGTVLSLEDRRDPLRTVTPSRSAAGDLAAALQTLDMLRVEAPEQAIRANGTGLVFDPDPRTALMENDLSNNSPVDRFSDAYEPRTLREMARRGARYYFQGPWVRIEDFEPPTRAVTTSETGQFKARRGEDAFNDVMAYYHLDKSQRYVHALGYARDWAIFKPPLVVDTDGHDGKQGSWYDSWNGRIGYGRWGVDDTEDADIIIHELGHALTDRITLGWSCGDAGAVAEGFGDYWAASYSLRTENGSKYHPAHVFQWDAPWPDPPKKPTWKGRRLNRLNATYDPRKRYGKHQQMKGFVSDELWSTPLFQTLLERRKSDESSHAHIDHIILEAQFGLGSHMRMPEVAAKIVDTAKRMFPGEGYAQTFRKHFVHHNILPVPSQQR